MSDTDRLARIEALLQEHIQASATRSGKMAEELAANTEVTNEIRDAAKALGWIKRAIMWVGGLAGGVFAIWQLWSAMSASRIGPGP